MEQWKDIKWYNGLYQVSNIWQVRKSEYRGVKHYIMKQSNSHGYLAISFWGSKSKTTYLVHRLVYLTFNNITLEFKGQKSKTLVCHKDDNKQNNRLDNLFLGTQQDNINDMMKKGRHITKRAQKVKIWFEDVPHIKKAYNKYKSIYKVADLYGVSYATISRVLNWKIWNSEN